MSSRVPKIERAGAPVDPVSEPERWPPPTDWSHEAVLAAAQAYRAEVMARWGRAAVAALARLWRSILTEPFRRWRAREGALRELAMVDEPQLGERGVPPGEIPYLTVGKLSPEREGTQWLRRAANRNLPPKRTA